MKLSVAHRNYNLIGNFPADGYGRDRYCIELKNKL